MKTGFDDLVDKTEAEAQRLLDEQDPGYTIKVLSNGDAYVFNKNGIIVMEFTSTSGVIDGE